MIRRAQFCIFALFIVAMSAPFTSFGKGLPLTESETEYLKARWGGNLDRKNFEKVQRFDQQIQKSMDTALNALNPNTISPKCLSVFTDVEIPLNAFLDRFSKVLFIRGQENLWTLEYLLSSAPPNDVLAEKSRFYFIWKFSPKNTLNDVFKKRVELHALSPVSVPYILILNEDVVTPSLLVHETLHKFSGQFDDIIQAALKIEVTPNGVSENISKEIERRCFRKGWF